MRTAILVSTPFTPDLKEQVASELHPKPDFLALAEALDATLITPGSIPKVLGHSFKAQRIGQAALAAFQARDSYDVIISDMDRVGLGLALLFKMVDAPNRHIMICHGKLLHRQDLSLIRAFQLQRYIHRFVCYGPAVARRLKQALSLPDYRVVTVQHPADHHFWHPLPATSEQLIVSAGMLHRDYPTLIDAVRPLDVSLILAASSPWVSKKRNGINPEGLPANVSLTRCSYLQLRELYARSRFVAIPLDDRFDQSGSLVMYEAMAMGKAVVTTRSQGQTALGILREGETGYYVAPGDVLGWREVIQHLFKDPEQASRMGQRARAVVEEGLNLDSYVRDMVSTVQSLAAEEETPKKTPSKAKVKT